MKSTTTTRTKTKSINDRYENDYEILDNRSNDNFENTKGKHEENDESYKSATDIYADDEVQDDEVKQREDKNEETVMVLSSSTDFFDDDANNDDSVGGDDDDGKHKKVTTRKNRHLINDEGGKAEEDEIFDEDKNDEEYEDDEKYMNEEGEGSGRNDANKGDERFEKAYKKYKGNLYRNRFSLDFTTNRNNKKDKTDSVFFDDEDEEKDDDDDDDEKNTEDDDDDDDSDNTRNREGSGGNFNDDNSRNSDDDDDAFFALKRRSNKYFRKNTNDAIKIISTPHGKVGIVYQQTDTSSSSGGNTKDKLNKDQEEQFNSSSSNRNRFLNQKITPVLTADGKVALLYRGESENTKYEPILNLTQTLNMINNNKNNFDNKTSAVNSNAKVDDGDDNDSEKINNVGSSNHHHYHHHHHHHSHSSSSNSNSGSGSGSISSTTKEDSDNLRPKFFDPPTDPIQHSSTSKPSFSISSSGGGDITEYENSILPNINRPLSEVLGIKKNQFRQFRIKDTSTTSTLTSTQSTTLATTSNDYYYMNHGLQKQTTINFKQIPPIRTNFDYDLDTSVREFDDRVSKYNQLDSGILRSESNNHQHQQQKEQEIISPSDLSSSSSSSSSSATQDILSKTEVVNLAIIPHFDEEFERQQQQHYRENEISNSNYNYNNRHHYKQRHRYRHLNEDLSGVHCAMQAMMGVAAISTVFGMLGAFFKQRILDQIRMMHW